MQLSEHFSLEEMISSEVAARSRIDNTPTAAVLVNLRILAAGLEQVRHALGDRPIHVNSGFRCLALNAAIGGAKHSMHVLGLAADIVCPRFGSPLDVCQAIVDAGIVTDQVIHEFSGWCHVAFAAPGTRARSQLLTIFDVAQGYQPGLQASA
jgi:zinc D-Ala-D-Ala carboxypeptidase